MSKLQLEPEVMVNGTCLIAVVRLSISSMVVAGGGFISGLKEPVALIICDAGGTRSVIIGNDVDGAELNTLVAATRQRRSVA